MSYTRSLGLWDPRRPGVTLPEPRNGLPYTAGHRGRFYAGYGEITPEQGVGMVTTLWFSLLVGGSLMAMAALLRYGRWT